MSIAERSLDTAAPPRHSWLRQVRLCHVPGESNPMLDEFVERLKRSFERLGHPLLLEPTETMDAFLTTARYDVPLDWRDSLLFRGRRRFGLKVKPILYTLIAITPAQLRQLLEHFERVLRKSPPDPADYHFDGLAPRAFDVLYEQGHRGGPMMCVTRLCQGRFKTLRAVLVVGEERAECAFVFDLAGAFPRCESTDPDGLAEDVALRLATSLSTSDLVNHRFEGEEIPREQWEGLAARQAMIDASKALGERRFFTTQVRIADLVVAPSLTDAVARQYSEGCFATWEPELDALVTTVTGSRNPVEKGRISEDDLAVVTGVTPDGDGALARPVAGLRNDPPSSEAVELKDVDDLLPWIELSAEWNLAGKVPVIRSKLHGHRGVAGYDPEHVEFLPLDEPYYHYPVSCSTAGQAAGIRVAFSRARCLLDPDDPRTIAFTVLPGHGMLMVEKWIPGKAPFEHLIEAMDAKRIEIVNGVPQGSMSYSPDPDGRMRLDGAWPGGREAGGRT